MKPIGVSDVTENHWVAGPLGNLRPLDHWATGALYDYEPSVGESERLRINPHLGSVVTSRSFIPEDTVSASIDVDMGEGGVKGDVGSGDGWCG